MILSQAASAHEDEANVPSVTLVQQAIAIIRSQPEQLDAIADKIKDALESTDSSGVDLDLVRRAQQAFEGDDLARTELLLERAVGANPGQPVASPNEGPRMPPQGGAPPAAENHLPVLAESLSDGAQATALIVVAVLLVLGGATVGRRYG